MMNRIDKKFAELKKKRKKAFIAFITAGDPSLKITEELVVSFEESGVDIVELGVPFSDPLADGPTIQAASQRALKKGVSLEKILNSVSRIRKKSKIPIALMTYYNPIFHYGEKKLIAKAKNCGVDGLIIPDLPPDESGNLLKLARKNNISVIFFLAPTTKKQRMKKIIKESSGFIYYVSVTGVTGARKKLSGSIAKHIRGAKRYTKKPICVGFGISKPEHIKSIAGFADGVIVGSAIVNKIVNNAGKKNLVSNVSHFVRGLSQGLK